MSQARRLIATAVVSCIITVAAMAFLTRPASAQVGPVRPSSSRLALRSALGETPLKSSAPPRLCVIRRDLRLA